MKNKFLLILIVSVLGFSQKKKINEEYDYINNYYQFVYEAQYEYLNNNYQKAYDLLKKAESNCPLLNQTGIYEPRILAECCVYLNKPKEAIDYLEILAKDYGYKVKGLKNDSIFFSLQKLRKWKNLQKNAEKYYNYYLKKVNIPLRQELSIMLKEDQKYRANGYDRKASEVVDSLNNIKLKKIVYDCDCYPNYGINEIGNYNVDEFDPEISVLVFHIDQVDAEYWKPVFLDLIKRGRAPADIYGNLIDSNLRGEDKFEYGIYKGTKSEKINDFENLDKRRIAVGLAPWQMKKDIFDLITKKYNIKWD